MEMLLLLKRDFRGTGRTKVGRRFEGSLMGDGRANEPSCLVEASIPPPPGPVEVAIGGAVDFAEL